MKSVTIYGASDDLIEVEGSLCDEFAAFNEENAKLAFSDGTVLSVEYDSEGCWRINRVVSGSAEYKKVEAEGSDTDSYTDRVTLTGDIKWVLYGTGFCRAR